MNNLKVPAPTVTAEPIGESMTGNEWIELFAAKLGTDAPDAQTIEDLLALAGTAAHASERIAAPIACYLIGRAGISIAEATAFAEAVAH